MMPIHPLITGGQIFTVMLVAIAFGAILVAAYEFGRRK